MNKIFRYELRRMVFSKFYLGLSAVTIWYGWQLLNTTTILGTAHTAPFSPWSFGCYLSRLLPLLWVSELFFLVYMFSGILLIVPLFKMLSAIGLSNSREAVIICMIVQTLPTAIYMTRSYFDTIPAELEEAGRVDGLSRMGIIFRIVVPLSISGIISVFVYAFMIAWNDVLFASIFIDSPDLMTIPIGLNSLFNTPDYIWGRMMAASLVTSLPVVIMYGISQHLIRSGSTDGGVKG